MTFVGTLWRCFCVICVVLCPTTAHAQTLEPHRLLFAGFGYAADYARISAQFPYSSAALEGIDLDKLLLTDSRSVPTPPELRIVANELGKLGPGDNAYVLALVFDDERVSQTEIDGKYKIVVNLAYSAAIFDFDRKELVASFPRRIVYIDYRNQPPDLPYLRQTFARLIGSETGSVRSGFWNIVGEMRLPSPSTRRLRVSTVELPDGFESAIGTDPDQYANNLGRLLSSAIAEGSGVPILPYSKNQVLSGKMASRIANADVFNFSIPEEDYAIEVKFTGFKKIPVKSNATGEVNVYGVYADFVLKDPLTGKLFYRASMKHGETKTLPRGAIQSSDIESMQLTGELFLGGLAGAIAADDVKWERTHLADKTSTVGSLKTLKEIFEKCR
jgi:hypothetical protein